MFKFVATHKWKLAIAHCFERELDSRAAVNNGDAIAPAAAAVPWIGAIKKKSEWRWRERE